MFLFVIYSCQWNIGKEREATLSYVIHISQVGRKFLYRDGILLIVVEFGGNQW